MATEFKHGEFIITLGRNGKFTANKDGNEVSSSSLAGIKKKLDAKSEFVPFAALSERYRGTGFEEVTVVGIKRYRSAWRGNYWILSNNREADRVIDDTPENRELVKQLAKQRKEAAKIKEQLEAEECAQLKKLVFRAPPEKQS